jgi:hypothetical protein
VAFHATRTATSSDRNDPPSTASDDILIMVTDPDMAAGGAEVRAGPAITPTAAAGALRTMR